MRCKKSTVDGGHDCKECDLLFWRGSVVGEKRCREALPDSIGVEGEHELDCRASEERRENGIDGAVNVVKWENVEKMVGR